MEKPHPSYIPHQNSETDLEIAPAHSRLAPPALLERAIQSGVTPEVLEKLMGLQERWEARNAKAAFNKAMADMRESLPPIIKNQKVDFTTNRGRTNYKYEDLNDVTEVLTPHMAKHGLAFRWRTQPGDPVTVACIVSHRDGHSEESSLSAPRDESGNKNAIQGLGSTITYLQRYTLKAALGVAAAVDDDGLSAGGRPLPPSSAAKPIKTPEKPFSAPLRASSEDVLPKKATEATRKAMLEYIYLVGGFNGQSVIAFAREKGYVAEGQSEETWNLDHVPTSKAGFKALADEIGRWLDTPEPPQDMPSGTEQELPAEIANVVWHIPPKSVKKLDYQPQTIGQLYAQRHDPDVANRLFGTMDRFEANGWTKDDGTKMPPSREDIALREGLDKLATWLETQKQSEFQDIVP